jgi:N-formylglutamate amidohydrolase
MNVWTTLDTPARPSRRMPWPELETPFSIVVPRSPVPVLFTFPHSGRHYPKSFQAQSALDAQALRASEDAWVDELFASAPRYGATTLCAHFPRAMVDVNRSARELDPDMYADHCPVNTRHKSPRVMAGLGVIPKIVSADVPIYADKIPYATALERLHHLHTPYHEAVQRVLNQHQQQTGRALLVDCHSMPSHCARHCPGGDADMVLGDGHGGSCDGAIIAHIEHVLLGMGYRVVRNTPYSGGYTTLRYGKPRQGVSALQIEINRALYMDEKQRVKTGGFARLRANMKILSKAICTYIGAQWPNP